MAVSVERIGIQGIGLIGTILFFLSYQCRSNKTLFGIQFVSYLCYTVHLLLLGAVTGGISYVLNTIRSFCLGKQKQVFEELADVCGSLCLASRDACVHMGRRVVCSSRSGEYRGDNRRIYIQCKDHPYGWAVREFSAVGDIRCGCRFMGGYIG